MSMERTVQRIYEDASDAAAETTRAFDAVRQGVGTRENPGDAGGDGLIRAFAMMWVHGLRLAAISADAAARVQQELINPTSDQ